MEENPRVLRQEKPRKIQRRFRNIIILMLLLVLVLLLVIQGCQATAATDPAASAARLERERLAETGIIPGMTDEEIQNRLDTIVAEGMFNVSMNSVVTFPTGKGEGDVRIENIAANRYACTVEIFLRNTTESILKTGLIDPGQFVEKMPLDRPLVEGAFECTAVFTAYNPKTQGEIGKVNMDIIVLVNG